MHPSHRVIYYVIYYGLPQPALRNKLYFLIMLPRVSRFMQWVIRIVVASCDTVDTHDIKLKCIPRYNEAKLNMKFKMFYFSSLK